MTHALSHLSRERRTKKTTKKKMMWHIYIWVNWSYFTIGLLYWGLILEALSFYGEIFLAIFKKKKN
jgi:hypothetical protein